MEHPPYLGDEDGEAGYVRHDLATANTALAYLKSIGCDYPDEYPPIVVGRVGMSEHRCGDQCYNPCVRAQDGWYDEVASGTGDCDYWKVTVE